MQVLIVGPALPEFILKAAQRIAPDGHVFVVGRRQGVIDRLQTRIQPLGFGNLTFEVSDNYELSLPLASIDRAYLVSALDKITDKLQLLRKVRRVLKPGGLLGVDQRLFDLGLSGRRAVMQWCKKAGYEAAASYGSPLHYFLIFRPA